MSQNGVPLPQFSGIKIKNIIGPNHHPNYLEFGNPTFSWRESSGYMDISENNATPKSSILNLNRVFHYRPTHFGVSPYFWNHPYKPLAWGWWPSLPSPSFPPPPLSHPTSARPGAILAHTAFTTWGSFRTVFPPAVNAGSFTPSLVTWWPSFSDAAFFLKL